MDPNNKKHNCGKLKAGEDLQLSRNSEGRERVC
jgi:hypothetical protein